MLHLPFLILCSTPVYSTFNISIYVYIHTKLGDRAEHNVETITKSTFLERSNFFLLVITPVKLLSCGASLVVWSAVTIASINNILCAILNFFRLYFVCRQKSCSVCIQSTVLVFSLFSGSSECTISHSKYNSVIWMNWIC